MADEQKKESQAPEMTSAPGVLNEVAARVIKTLWSNGVIVVHPENMLHADGLHRFAIAPTISNTKLASTAKQVFPDVLQILQGVLPRDAKIDN